MNFKASHGMGLFGIAPLAVVLLVGCGDSSTLDPSLIWTSKTELHGKQTLTIHVPRMSDRLELF